MINVTAIKLPDSLNGYKDNTNENLEFLEPVSKINIFVGSNNSGKSRFIRKLAKQYEYSIRTQDTDLEIISSEILSFIEKTEKKFNEQKIVGVNFLHLNELYEIRNKMPVELNTNDDVFDGIREQFKTWKNYEQVISVTPQDGWRVNLDYSTKEHIANVIKLGANRVFEFLDRVPIYSQSDNPKKVYIPTLRGLRPLDEQHNDYYLDRTRKDYFYYQDPHNDSSEGLTNLKRPEIFTGLSLYQRLIDLLLGNNSERNLIQSYQKFISETLYEGKPIALIPKPKEKIIVVKISKEKEQPIHHLGDGIQSTIILTFLPFITDEQTFFFIEEPEMYMHPGLQRKILNFYSSLKQHTFFLTTHSNHFLDLTIDIKDVSIFTFRKVFDESDENELTPSFTIEAVVFGL